LAATTTAIPARVRADASCTQSSTRSVKAVMPPEAGGVPAGVDLDLEPAAPVGDVVLSRLHHQAAHVVGVRSTDRATS
jgi:hypothetical protein